MPDDDDQSWRGASRAQGTRACPKCKSVQCLSTAMLLLLLQVVESLSRLLKTVGDNAVCVCTDRKLGSSHHFKGGRLIFLL